MTLTTYNLNPNPITLTLTPITPHTGRQTHTKRQTDKIGRRTEERRQGRIIQERRGQDKTRPDKTGQDQTTQHNITQRQHYKDNTTQHITRLCKRRKGLKEG
jgi:hypothetical protein